MHKIFHHFTIILILLIASSAFANGSSNDSSYVFKDIRQVKSSNACFSGTAKSYESWLQFTENKSQNFNLEKFQKNYPEYQFNHYKSTLVCFFFTYEVEGQIIDGYYIAPKIADKIPIIIFNRGGSGVFGSMEFSTLLSHVFYMADAGYAIIGSQYRGGTNRSINNGGKDEWGGSDVKDVEALFNIIDQLKNIDSKRIGMYGGSRGSINMFMTAKNTKRVKALVSAAGVYDLMHELNFRPSMEKIYSKHIPNYANNKLNEFNNRSVIKWADKLDLNAPILLLHCSYDKRVSATGALNFSLRLQQLAHRFSLIIFEAGDHFFTDHQKQVRRLTIEWFNKYL